MSPFEDPEDPGQEQTFVSHLMELRDRLIRMLLAVLLALLVLFPFANDIYTYVAMPLMERLPEGTSMIATQVASPFLTPFKLTLVAAVFLAMPYLLFQLWSFVAPGLYKHEKRLAIPLLISSALLFYLGVLFAYYVVFPLIFAFFTGTAPQGVAVMTDISQYLDFVLTLFFAFGIAFEIPIATILLVAAGITTPKDLARKRPYVIVGVFVVGMFLTPPDVISQTLLAFPMWLLFELGIFFSGLFERRRKASWETAATSTGPADTDVGAGGAAVLHPGEALGASTEPGMMSGRRGAKRGGEEPLGSEGTGAGADPHASERQTPVIEEETGTLETEGDLDALEIDSEELDEPDSVEQKIWQINKLRDREDYAGARRLLYEVLEEGDDEQRRVARNILDQMDEF
jgi:sec-independent protein translocase protein TatC